MPTDAFGRFGALMREGGANISVIGTDQWQLQVAATLVGLKRASDDIKAMYAPDDAQAAHVYALAVADDLDEIVTYTVEGVANLDPAAMRQAGLATSRVAANTASILAIANSCRE